MAYTGNTPTSQGFTSAVDYFNGDGVTVAFTLSRPVASVYQVEVVVDNVVQNPSSAYNILNDVITFTGAPLGGTNNIWVRYVALNTVVSVVQLGTVGTPQLGNINTIVSATSLVLKTNSGVAALTIDASQNVGIGTSSSGSPGGRLHVAGDANGYICVERGIYPAGMLMRRANGSVTSPTQVLSGDLLAVFSAQGYTNASAYSPTIARVSMAAAENFTNTGNGAYLSFETTSIGTATLTERMRIDSSGNVGIGTSSPACQLDIGGTGAMKFPSGTTAQRPVSPVAGMVRFNTTILSPEWYDSASGQWVQYNKTAPYQIQYIVVASGGGGGGTNNIASGGGGAGGYVAGSIYKSTGEVLTVTIGGGGAGGVGSANAGSGSSGGIGSSSVFGALTALGGGGGSPRDGVSPMGATSGGSGGGAAESGVSFGAGTIGQGNNGGTGGTATRYYGCGGGGASQAGFATSGTTSGNGGAGTADTWTGASRTLAGGGSGGRYGGSGGIGGAGGGGSANGGAGTGNTGGGGAGTGSYQAYANGGAGGSGIVILRYLGAQRGSGGTITSSGGYTLHTFITSGSYTT